MIIDARAFSRIYSAAIVGIPSGLPVTRPARCSVVAVRAGVPVPGSVGLGCGSCGDLVLRNTKDSLAVDLFHSFQTKEEFGLYPQEGCITGNVGYVTLPKDLSGVDVLDVGEKPLFSTNAIVYCSWRIQLVI